MSNSPNQELHVEEDESWSNIQILKDPNQNRTKKHVTFSPDTVNYERETKPFKYHNLFRLAQMGIFLNAEGSLVPPPPFLKSCNPKLQQALTLDLSGNTEQLRQKICKVASIVDENEYLRFTHARKTRDYMEKTSGPSATRAQRLYTLLDELKIAHDFYNQLKTTTTRDKFLMEELITRHIMGLDLALSEGYLGVALEITRTMYDTTKFMLPLYSHLLYNEDGSRADLPLGVIEEAADVEDYVRAVSPVIAALNRISENRARNDHRSFNRETILTKLQLEMIALTLCPVESAMFRGLLEILPETGLAAYEALSLSEEDTIRWANNSLLRSDYEIILQSLGFADKVGCKGVNFTMVSFAARARAKDFGTAAALFELPPNNLKI